MEIEIQDVQQGRILRLAGKIDIMSSPDLRAALNDAIVAKTESLIIDMSQVSYLDSSGLATFLEGLKSMKEYGGKMTLVRIPERIEKILKLMKLDIVFNIKDDIE